MVPFKSSGLRWYLRVADCDVVSYYSYSRIMCVLLIVDIPFITWRDLFEYAGEVADPRRSVF